LRFSLEKKNGKNEREIETKKGKTTKKNGE
jgi:hypothetical protein